MYALIIYYHVAIEPSTALEHANNIRAFRYEISLLTLVDFRVKLIYASVGRDSPYLRGYSTFSTLFFIRPGCFGIGFKCVDRRGGGGVYAPRGKIEGSIQLSSVVESRPGGAEKNQWPGVGIKRPVDTK
jgi:hypothetical protein